MSKDAKAMPLSRILRIDDLKEHDSETSATEAEKAEIAALLELKALDDLTFTYRLRQGGNGRLHLSGRLKAAVVQTCVVTLDPVEAELDIPVEAEFWPQRLIEGLEQSAETHDGAFDWPEPIQDGRIDLGPLIYETLAMSLDPYPKREGASFEWSQDKGEAPAGISPFAALEALRRR
jgi:uncharacterized metal-binding protein YceD (DUF177 family)